MSERDYSPLAGWVMKQEAADEIMDIIEKQQFKEKLRSLQWSTKGFDTREPKNYYDAEALESTFGHDAKDKMLEKTQGLGGGEVINGEHYHYEKGERVKTTPKQMENVYLNAKSEDWEN